MWSSQVNKTASGGISEGCSVKQRVQKVTNISPETYFQEFTHTKKSCCSGKQGYWQAVFCISRPLTTSIVFPLQLNRSWIPMNSTWDVFLFPDSVNDASLFQSQPNCRVHKSPVKTERNTVWPGQAPWQILCMKTSNLNHLKAGICPDQSVG